MRRFYKVLLFFIVFFVMERFCHKQTKGFKSGNIISQLEYNSEWETEPLSIPEQAQIEEILNQPFYFLGSGLECYAFVSQDQKTVLKAFKHHHTQIPNWYKMIPLPNFFDRYRTKYIEAREERIPRSFRGCKLAFEELKEETGILYLHLNKTPCFQKKLTLFDNLGIAHSVDLDSIEFILQKKADLFLPRLTHLMKEKNIEGAQECLNSYLSLILQRCKKGIYDRDPTLTKNFGFIENQAIIIDLGSFSKNPFLKNPKDYKRELFYNTLSLKCLIEKNFPELSEYLNQQINSFIGAENGT